MDLQIINITLMKNDFERKLRVEENQKVTLKVSVGLPDSLEILSNACPINLDILSMDGKTGKEEMFKIRLEYIIEFNLAEEYHNEPKTEIIDNIMEKVEDDIKKQIDSILNYAGLAELNISLKRRKELVKN